tara:strand:+ start:1287 stop:2579 length:1293 start_codon:yes stop_codon:yes gene_type:complete
MDPKSITIIGSGINSYFFIRTVLKKGFKVNLIDVDTETNSSDSKKKNYKNNISPKIILKNFEEKIQTHKEYNKLIYNNFDNQSALDIGGLSNLWGGCVYKFSDYELTKNKLNKFNLYEYLKYLYEDNYFLKQQDTDNFFEKNIDKYKYNLNYNNLLLSHNNEPLNVKRNFKNLIKEKKIKFFPGFVENISKDGDKYILSINSKNNKYKLIDKKLVLAAGSLSSARILMQLLKVNSVRLLCTPSNQSIFISSRKQIDMSLNSLLSFNKKNQSDIKSSIFPLKGLNNEFFLDYIKLNSKILLPFVNFLKQYLYGVYTYHSSDYSNIKIKRNNINFKIEGMNANNNQNQLNNFYNKKLIKIPFTTKSLLQGNDNHIGGTFPLEKYFTDFNELKNFKNLFVIDGTYLNYIPPLGYTLVTILNSIRIAEKLATEK